MTADLENIFVCVSCKGEMYRDDEALTCAHCGRVYQIRDGIPVMFPTMEELEQRGIDPHKFREVVEIYEKAYQHGQLMGTDLDAEYRTVTKSKLVSFVEHFTDLKVLDVGCGSGHLFRHIPEANRPFGIDVSLQGLQIAKREFPGLLCSVSLAEFLPFRDNFFDAVFAVDTLEHTLSLDWALKEIRRVMKPESSFCALLPTQSSLLKWGQNQFLRRLPDPVMVWNLITLLFKRQILFGRIDFQPIDRDFEEEDCISLFNGAGFRIERLEKWPERPLSPLAFLVHLKKTSS